MCSPRTSPRFFTSQRRLQDDIAVAMNASVEELLVDADSVCHRAMPKRLARWVHRHIIERVAEPLGHLWDHIATELMMTLATPDEVLRLHHDVPLLSDGTQFPLALAHPTSQPLRRPAQCLGLDRRHRCGFGRSELVRPRRTYGLHREPVPQPPTDSIVGRPPLFGRTAGGHDAARSSC